ncbi:PorP/SprF family type IX secretion system membrane protein [Ferruginibacter albus]|uniref:PorP/SprF family type IX secretion system membrane protein n=1 Tax=Ferruginibacter albus TaxID=2875540 RepID=UPI001CC79A22|nr:type IX secretion system membrane protein PorP/SprF [Ferruginibacter albus]UAY53647.1 type IX secretion system membrane protein PorP/SprF [Ferruginibacter albus]
MNKLKLVVVFILGSLAVNAQQKPYYTQYILNNYILNPALSGIENYTDVKLSYRNQWTGIDGAPKTMYVSIQGPINKKDYRTNATSYEIPGENPRGESYWESYTAAEPHSGVGLSIVNDKTGYINRTSVYGTYAYHKGISGRTSLALGFQAGFTNVSIDRSKITLPLDPQDPALGYDNGELKKFTPEVGAGVWLYSRDYFLGASVLNIIPGKAAFVKNAGNYGSSFSPQMFLTGGYRFLLGGDMSVLPSALIQYNSAQPVQVHLNCKVQYMDLVWFGGSYRITDELGGFAAMAGINVSNTFNIGYSYDLATTSRLQGYTGGTHEIIIGFLINNRYGDTCPRNIW